MVIGTTVAFTHVVVSQLLDVPYDAFSQKKRQERHTRHEKLHGL